MTEALPNEEFHRILPLLREEGFYTPEPQRKIAWPEYNQTQIMNAEDVLLQLKRDSDEKWYR